MSETITIQVRATDLEVDRAINAYIPILECSYQLARGLPFSLPDGYQEIGRVSASAGDVGRMARAGDAREARPEARALAAAVAHPDLFGFIVREVATGAVIASIRGTLVPEEWLRNFTAIPADYSFLPHFGTVHLGFRLVYDSVRASLEHGLAAVSRDTRVTVLGHSLGGAMATLAAPDIKRNLNQDNVDVCTFGGPRVGKPDFRGKFNGEIARCYRITNQFDIVPHVPTIVTGWMHVGEEVEVDGNLDHPHSLVAYLAGLRAIEVPDDGLTSRILERRGPMSAVVP
jgi:triacylglycerol lipase